MALGYDYMHLIAIGSNVWPFTITIIISPNPYSNKIFLHMNHYYIILNSMIRFSKIELLYFNCLVPLQCYPTLSSWPGLMW